MFDKTIVNDIFPDWLTGSGIFSHLSGVPWDGEGIAAELDLEYHGNVSGNKMVSPLVAKLADDEQAGDKLAGVIKAINGRRWAALWETMQLEYNPIENYSMTETMTNDKTVTEYGKSTTRTDDLTHARTGTDAIGYNSTDKRTDDLTHGKTGTEAVQYQTTDTRTDNLTENQQNRVNGFNSAVGVNSGDTSTSNTGTQTNAKTGTDTTTYNTQEKDTGTQTAQKTGTDTTTYNTQDKNTGTQKTADAGSDTSTRNYLLKRSGNIGVTTSQQMIESERNLWKWVFFREVVFPDIDKVLTLAVY